jgi:hypothetical protein
MGEIIMNEELKEKLAKVTEECADAASASMHNSEDVAAYAKAAEWFTKAMLNLKNSEGLCFGGEILEITEAP